MTLLASQILAALHTQKLILNFFLEFQDSVDLLEHKDLLVRLVPQGPLLL
jgi:hypothetical protein